MPIPTEPIGSIPRPQALIDAMAEFINGNLSQERMNALYAEALQNTIRRFEQTGSPGADRDGPSPVGCDDFDEDARDGQPRGVHPK